jgi:alkyldihydroxyacetonephosphate synthase
LSGAAGTAVLTRRLAGWGYEGVTVTPPPAMLDFLRERLGQGSPAMVKAPRLDALPKPRQLPRLGVAASTAALDRLAHARGQGLPDLLWLRAGTAPALPDAVLRPAEDDVPAVLAACAKAGVRVVPRGGGTSVTGGVNALAGDPPVVVLDLERLAGLLALDGESQLATFGAGTLGPAVEAALGPYGLTLGHLPQSWQLSTIGGWAVTRSAGQESLGVGRIEDLVAGVELVAPMIDGGKPVRLTLPAQPASAAGPELRRLVLGSEGRLGVVTRVTVRLRAAPPRREVIAWLLPEWDAGTTLVRELVQAQAPLAMLRLSDPTETATALLVGLAHAGGAADLVRRYLDWRGVGAGCLLLAGAAGGEGERRRAFAAARPHLRRHGGVALGRGAGGSWLADRFRHPYLRDGLLDAGYATETLETAVPWSQVAPVRRRMIETLTEALAAEGERVVVLCHLSHPYLDGSSLYFTCFFRVPPDPAAAVARWATFKRAANARLVELGATLSHHHGVGSWHAPWLPAEIGAGGVRTLAAAAAALDPAGVMNPHVLLDPVDRLEA